MDYVDPSRRVAEKKVFQLRDSKPDILKLINKLKKITGNVLIKSSPLLDIKKTLDDIGNINNVYVVAVKNEVKEVLFHHSSVSEDSPTRIHAINIHSGGREEFSFDYSQESVTNIEIGEVSENKLLYETNRAILKAGAFKLIGKKFHLMKLHPNTHLYVSDVIHPEFPGRIFQIVEILNSKKIKGKKLNVIARNYPLTADTIRKKFKIRDGRGGLSDCSRYSQ